ncbi:MAG: TolC family protein [Bacteroidetes bacterium]|nr:TolC family protein [Bacteroidota bacterium]
MGNRIKWMVLSLVYLFSAFIIKAQVTSFPVTLETVLQLAGANNLTVQEYQLKYQQALAEQSKAKEWWLPEIQAGYSTHFLNGAAMNTDGNILSDLNRNNLWVGLGVSAEIDFKNGFYRALAARQKSEAANYFTIAERNQVILKSVQTYFDLQAEQLKYSFLQTMASQADTIAQQLRVQVDAGLRFQSEYLLAQSNHNHLKISMLQAKTEWRKISSLLTNLLALEGINHLVSADTLFVAIAFTLPSSDSISFENRSEYLGLNTELNSIHTFRKTENQGLLLPKLKVGFDNGAFGAYSNPLYNTYQFNASLLWSLPLGRITHRGDLKKWDVKILSQQNKVEQFKNKFNQEITTATAQIEIVGQQIEIAKDALAQIVEALRQSIERQKMGTAEPFEVFQAQQFYLQAQLDYLQAVSEYNKSQFALKVTMGDIL